VRNLRSPAALRGCEEIAKPRHPILLSRAGQAEACPHSGLDRRFARCAGFSLSRFAQETDLGARTSGPQSLDVLVRRPMRRDATVVRPEVGRLRTRGPLSAFIPISSQPLRMTGTWGGRGGNFASRPSKSVQRKGQLKM